jgi:hypothetical protein
MTEVLAEKKCVPCRDVRFGSLAEAKTFTSMSALPPKADILHRAKNVR